MALLALLLTLPLGVRAQATPPDPLLAESAKLVEQLDAVAVEAAALREAIREATGEDRAVAERQLAEKRLAYLELTGQLVDNLQAQEEAGLDASGERAQIEARLGDLSGQIAGLIERDTDQLAQLRVDREQVEAEGLPAYEQRIARQAAWVDTLYRAEFRRTAWLDEAGIDAAAARAALAERLQERADQLAGRVQVAADEIAALRAHPPSDAAEAERALAILEIRRDAVAASLRDSVGMLNELGIDAAGYTQVLISATGEVTRDSLRGEVVLGLLTQWLAAARSAVAQYTAPVLFKLAAFFAIVALFWLLGRLARFLVRRAVGSGRLNVSQLLQNMLQALVGRTVVLLGVLFALSQLGLEITALLTGLGIAGFIVGFALQDTLGNFAAGMMILGYRPFDVGDTVEVGQVFGKVSHMSLVSTTILTFDNQTLIVPNGKIWGDVIKNVTNQQQRRVDMSFRVSYDDDVEQVERVLQDIVRSHEKVFEDPEPLIKVHKLDESHVEWIVRPWTGTADYWSVYWDVTREVKRRFDAEGITIPVPQREIRVQEADRAAVAQDRLRAGR